MVTGVRKGMGNGFEKHPGSKKEGLAGRLNVGE